MSTLPRKVWALLPAAGVGARMRAAGGAHKALLYLNGRPLVYRSLERLFEVAAITGAVVAAHADDREEMQRVVAPLREKTGKPIEVVAGGETRQASCKLALDRAERLTLNGEELGARVLFHDAARPLVTAAEIQALLAALDSHPVAVLAAPVTQTVKRADTAGQVEATVPRDRLFLAQTPQGFRFPDALTAFAQAQKAGFEGTDDVALAEFCGMPVKIVPGSAWNIKITTPEDLALAQAILTLQGRS